MRVYTVQTVQSVSLGSPAALVYTMKAMAKCMPELKFQELFAIDPKVHAQQFMQANTRPGHIYKHVGDVNQALASDSPAWCCLHKSMCPVAGGHSGAAQPKILLCGFPCAPYSSQRGDRHVTQCWGTMTTATQSRSCFRGRGLVHHPAVPQRWTSHPLAGVMDECVQLAVNVDAGIFENVIGFTHVPTNHTSSPLEILKARLEAKAFHVKEVILCNSAFAPCVRRRPRSNMRASFYSFGLGRVCFVEFLWACAHVVSLAASAHEGTERTSWVGTYMSENLTTLVLESIACHS
eukprot:3830870-Amphidinium_carterae.2